MGTLRHLSLTVSTNPKLLEVTEIFLSQKDGKASEYLCPAISYLVSSIKLLLDIVHFAKSK